MEQQSGQALSNVEVVPGEDERAISAARTALTFAVAGVIALFGVYLVDAQFFRLGLDFSLRYPLSYVGFALVCILASVSIILGIRSRLASRQIQPSPRRAISLARRAIALGVIAVVLASLSALVEFVLSNISFTDV